MSFAEDSCWENQLASDTLHGNFTLTDAIEQLRNRHRYQRSMPSPSVLATLDRKIIDVHKDLFT